ncbi:hypothetical protein OXPF_22820 [Oxobacter pfennigii]|uniref:Uncharacterized protein n=1 Tax=Oxobacter pfennigii TaxID=36849 RepID=A0A0P8YWL4_9CLOT|nr:hypothetical protein [Oxobacter pfennigii]KPU44115.1 hypothetical protein OXPF_22820 [Oxobacter pfennigii]
MDFGVIILFIIFSIVGSMIKESKKQANENRNKEAPDNIFKTEINPEVPKKTVIYGNNRDNFNTGTGSNKMKRKYELKDLIEDSMTEFKSLLEEGKAIRNTVNKNTKYVKKEALPKAEEVFSVKEENQRIYVPLQSQTENKHAASALTFNSEIPKVYESYDELILDEERLLNGIILAEVLGPPRCRR